MNYAPARSWWHYSKSLDYSKVYTRESLVVCDCSVGLAELVGLAVADSVNFDNFAIAPSFAFAVVVLVGLGWVDWIVGCFGLVLVLDYFAEFAGKLVARSVGLSLVYFERLGFGLYFGFAAAVAAAPRFDALKR